MAIHIAVYIAAVVLNMLSMAYMLAVGQAIGKAGSAANMGQSERHNTKTSLMVGLICAVASFLLVALCIIDLAKA